MLAKAQHRNVEFTKSCTLYFKLVIIISSKCITFLTYPSSVLYLFQRFQPISFISFSTILVHISHEHPPLPSGNENLYVHSNIIL